MIEFFVIGFSSLSTVPTASHSFLRGVLSLAGQQHHMGAFVVQ